MLYRVSYLSFKLHVDVFGPFETAELGSTQCVFIHAPGEMALKRDQVPHLRQTTSTVISEVTPQNSQ